ncbi:DoxX family protein [Glycomyces tenuis]|nr:DoxX family protein [Glycomyces tenuis]
MLAAYAIVTVLTIAANVWAAVIDFMKADPVVANSDALGLPRSWLFWLGVLKLAGAAGLTLGLLGLRPLGVAAALGLVLFFVGAIIAHLRARVLGNIPFPGVFLALAVATLALTAAQ